MLKDSAGGRGQRRINFKRIVIFNAVNSRQLTEASAPPLQLRVVTED